MVQTHRQPTKEPEWPEWRESWAQISSSAPQHLFICMTAWYPVVPMTALYPVVCLIAWYPVVCLTAHPVVCLIAYPFIYIYIIIF